MADSRKHASVRNSLVRELLGISDYIEMAGDIIHPYNRNLMATIKTRYNRLLKLESEFLIAQNNVMLSTCSLEDRILQDQFRAKFENVYSEAKNKYRAIINRSIIVENFIMPKFDGSLGNWMEFKTESRKMLEDYIPDNVKRLRCMKEAVSGKAAELLCPLAEKEANYAVAWNILENYYDKMDTPSTRNTFVRDLEAYLDQGFTTAQVIPSNKPTNLNPISGNFGIRRQLDESDSQALSLFNQQAPIARNIKPSSLGMNTSDVMLPFNQEQPTSISRNMPNLENSLIGGPSNHFNQPSADNISRVTNHNQFGPPFNQRPPCTINNFTNRATNDFATRPGVPQANTMVRAPNDYFIRSGVPQANTTVRAPNDYLIRSGIPQANTMVRAPNDHFIRSGIPQANTTVRTPNDFFLKSGIPQANTTVRTPNDFFLKSGMPQANTMVRTPNDSFVRSCIPQSNMEPIPNNFVIGSGIPRNNIGQVPNQFGITPALPQVNTGQVPNNFGFGSGIDQVHASLVPNNRVSQVSKDKVSNHFPIGSGASLFNAYPSELISTPNAVTNNQHPQLQATPLIRPSLHTQTARPTNNGPPYVNARPPTFNQMVNNQQRTNENNNSELPRPNGHSSSVDSSSMSSNKSWLKDIIASGPQQSSNPKRELGTPPNLKGSNSGPRGKSENVETVITIDSDSDCEIIEHPSVEKYAENNAKKRKTNFTLRCFICSGNHYVFGCSKFLSMTPASRLISTEKLEICNLCLRINCNDHPCKFKSSCKKCGKNHHTLLHVEESSSGIAAKNMCDVCGDLHEIKNCPKFLKMTWFNRMKAKDVLKICASCVRVKCDAGSCQKKSNCLHCAFPHHTLFHPSSY